jgi:hypothetical protein
VASAVTLNWFLDTEYNTAVPLWYLPLGMNRAVAARPAGGAAAGAAVREHSARSRYRSV